MELKQANIYGGYTIVVAKKQPKNVPKKIKTYLKYKIKILYDMYEQLYEKQNISLLDNRDAIIKGNIISYPEERQAEPLELINLNIYDIDERIKKMKEVLNV